MNLILKSVAKRVGHGAATLKKHYLIPELSREYIEKGIIIDLKDNAKFNKGGELDCACDHSNEEKLKKQDLKDRLHLLEEMLIDTPKDKKLKARINLLKDMYEEGGDIDNTIKSEDLEDSKMTPKILAPVYGISRSSSTPGMVDAKNSSPLTEPTKFITTSGLSLRSFSARAAFPG